MKAGVRETGIDFERFRLRGFVEDLHRSGELEVRAAPAELRDVAAALEGNAQAVLFERVGREGAQLVGNVMGSRARLARAFGAAPDKLLAEVLRRLRGSPQIAEVPPEAAPVQQVVLAGARDGREVVLALEALREAGRLARETDGRYALARQGA